MTCWREGGPVLEEVDWQIEKGEHWALIGENGAGKTTLLNVVTGYLWPMCGSVEVLGERFGRTDVAALRRRIGWMSASLADQIAAWHAEDNAIQVVLSGLHGSIGLWTRPTSGDQARAMEILSLFRCGHLAQRLFRTLSQGERQRVLLARAFAADAQLLILDEPCSGLDLRAREELLDAVGVLAKRPAGPQLLYVTHHVEEVVPTLTHALLLKRGRVVAKGPKREVITSEVLSSAFDIELEVQWHRGRPWAFLP